MDEKNKNHMNSYAAKTKIFKGFPLFLVKSMMIWQ